MVALRKKITQQQKDIKEKDAARERLREAKLQQEVRDSTASLIILKEKPFFFTIIFVPNKTVCQQRKNC